MPAWTRLSGPFLADFAAAGFAPEAIDTVMCTHLHFDHVGWNTRLARPAVPTFPNARYLFGRVEWRALVAEAHTDDARILAESVEP